MKEVKSIALVLENCEVISISKEHIGSFHCKDIIGIDITYADDTAEYCIMPWKDGDSTGCNNKYQTSYVSKSGNMHICICRGKSIEDMADFDSIDNLK